MCCQACNCKQRYYNIKDLGTKMFFKQIAWKLNLIIREIYAIKIIIKKVVHHHWNFLPYLFYVHLYYAAFIEILGHAKSISLILAFHLRLFRKFHFLIWKWLMQEFFSASYATCFTVRYQKLHSSLGSSYFIILSIYILIINNRTYSVCILVYSKRNKEDFVLSIVRYNFYLNKEYTTILFDPTINGKILLRTSYKGKGITTIIILSKNQIHLED